MATKDAPRTHSAQNPAKTKSQTRPGVVQKAAVDAAPQTRVPAPAHPASRASGAPSEAGEPDTTLRKRELVDEVSARTGLPKGRVRAVVEAMLDVLGDAVTAERPMQLPPLGKVMPKHSKMQDDARITHVKIRQSKAKPRVSDPPDG